MHTFHLPLKPRYLVISQPNDIIDPTIPLQIIKYIEELYPNIFIIA